MTNTSTTDRHDSHVRLYKAAMGFGARCRRDGSRSAAHAAARASFEMAQHGDLTGPVCKGWREQDEELAAERDGGV